LREESAACPINQKFSADSAIGQLMSDTLLVGIMSVIATVILAPIAVKLLSILSEKRSQLLVLLTWNAAAKNTKLKERVTNLVVKSQDFRDAVIGDESKYEELRILQTFLSSQSYMRFKVSNNSRKKLAHLTLFDDEYSNVYQIDDGGLCAVDRSQPIVLDDLQPGREIILHLWSTSNLPTWIPDSKKRFTFSADELDRVKIKEPMPEYLKRRCSQWGLKYLLLCMITIWIGAVVLGYLLPK
jgi:hypothetical protein